jgi:hypothetical protein|tara:strand:- start:2345 stop:2536 length:192 start_codon:yes stop_codon:yes gene_type:complete
MKLIELDNAISIPLSNEEHEVFFKYVNTNIKENKDIDEREKLLLQKMRSRGVIDYIGGQIIKV